MAVPSCWTLAVLLSNVVYTASGLTKNLRTIMQRQLPAPDWESATDPASGHTYYYNRVLNISQWELPEASGGEGLQLNESSNLSATEASMVGAAVASATAGVPFTIRYTFLNPDGDEAYMRGDGSSMLRSSLCLSESNLAPALLTNPSFGVLPTYLIYTDNSTHAVAEELVASSERFQTLASRTRLVNLDTDPHDAERLAPLANLSMDAKNTASVRRTLADAVYLAPSDVVGARLLLGTDVSFVRAPKILVTTAAALTGSQALYMPDMRTFQGALYSIANYSGPQCSGLIGDFIYLAPAVNVSLRKLQDIMSWYGSLPRVAERIDPPCGICAELSSGLHAIDQFAWVGALGDAVSPPGSEGCFALDGVHYAHMPGPERFIAEAVHDKVISKCVL